MSSALVQTLCRHPKGQERREVVPMGAAAPTDGKRALSAAGSPEGSRPFGKVSPQGRWEFPGKLPYLVLQITAAIDIPQAPADLRARGKREKGATRRGERNKIYGGRS